MRVLQLTSDWKWTGPAEPMLRLALALRERGCGVWLGCPEAPEPATRSVASEARVAGLKPDVVLHRARGVRPFGDRAEVRRLRALLDEHDVDIVHTWHTRDHVLALRAAAGRRRAGRTRVVRSYRTGSAIPTRGKPWNRWLFGPGTDGLLCVSPRTAVANRSLRGGRPVQGVFGAVDLDRYTPGPTSARPGLGLEPEHLVVGIVARVQSHRRFDLLLEAARRLFAREPRARLLVVGRGTRIASLAEEPARALGISDRVVFAGYRHEDYVDVLRAMDVFTLLVPGSDGTCRALLEAAACGIPAVASRREALPELVEDGVTGLLVDEDPEPLARAWERLLGDETLRRRMGAAARARAEKCFVPSRGAEQVLEFYRSLAT